MSIDPTNVHRRVIARISWTTATRESSETSPRTARSQPTVVTDTPRSSAQSGRNASSRSSAARTAPLVTIACHMPGVRISSPNARRDVVGSELPSSRTGTGPRLR